ncbi:MAG: putative protein [Desulfovibrio sp.]
MRMEIGKKTVAALAGIMFLMLGSVSPTKANSEYEKIELSMTVNGTDIATDTKVAQLFAKMVSDASGGRITVNVFPNDQLAGGNATKGIEMVSVGAVDLAAYATSTMSVLDEQLLVGTIPWAFDSYKQARQIIDTTGGEYYAKVLAKQGLTFLGSTHNGFRQISNSKRAVKTPDDVQGLKIRVPGGEVYIKFFKELGADPVAMSWSETFTAIQQKTIDGQENGFSVTNSAKMYEIQKYMTVWNYTYENYLFVASGELFDSLKPQTQQLIREKAREACEWGRDLVEREQEELKVKFTGQGMEITELSPEELAPFKAAVTDLRAYLQKKYGSEACAAFGM